MFICTFPSELNHCEKNPGTCKNGGKCRSLPQEDGLFRCECPTGFKGKSCEFAPLPPPTTTTTTTTTTTEASDVSVEETSLEAEEESTTVAVKDGVVEDVIENET